MLELTFPILINMAIFPCYPHCTTISGQTQVLHITIGVNVPGMSVKFPV
jgi:hypothetical protein